MDSRENVWDYYWLVLFILNLTVCASTVTTGICDPVDKTVFTGRIYSPDFPSFQNVSSCECNMTSSREVMVELNLFFVSETLVEEEVECYPSVHYNELSLCPNLKQSVTSSHGYRNVTTVLYIKNNEANIALFNPYHTQHKMQITYKVLKNRNVHLSCGPYFIPAVMAPLSQHGGFSRAQQAGVVIAVIFVAIIVLSAAAYLFFRWRSKDESENKRINRSKDHYDEGRGDNPGYQITPKSSVYNISINDSFSLERGPEVSFENPDIAGHGLTLPFKYSQVSLASADSHQSKGSSKNKAFGKQPAVEVKRTGSPRSENHQKRIPEDGLNNNNVNDINNRKVSFNHQPSLTSPQAETIPAASPDNIPTSSPTSKQQPNKEGNQSDDGQLVAVNPKSIEPKIVPTENRPVSKLPPQNISDVKRVPRHETHPTGHHPISVKPIHPSKTKNIHNLPPGHPARVYSPQSFGSPPYENNPITPPPSHLVPVKLDFSPHMKQLSPSDEDYYPDDRASPLTLPLPYTAPVIPLSAHGKPFNVSSESIPYIDQSGLDLSLRIF